MSRPDPSGSPSVHSADRLTKTVCFDGVSRRLAESYARREYGAHVRLESVDVVSGSTVVARFYESARGQFVLIPRSQFRAIEREQSLLGR